jgi:hypothetical protein
MKIVDTPLDPPVPPGDYFVMELEGRWSVNQIDILGYVDSRESPPLLHQWLFPAGESGTALVGHDQFRRVFLNSRLIYSSNTVAVQALLDFPMARLRMALGTFIPRTPEEDVALYNRAKIRRTLSWIEKFT